MNPSSPTAKLPVQRAASPEPPRRRLPEWLRRPPGSVEKTRALKQILRRSTLNTVCEEARCPNISECFASGTATFMILGDICTRGCRFCSVHTGRPTMPAKAFAHEAEEVAQAAVDLGLSYVVVTSVARDDLEDGGAAGFALTIGAIRRRLPAAKIEVLVPDFRGKPHALRPIVEAQPDVFNHNLETVPRLYRRVRPGASYRGSLDLLAAAKELRPEMATKTGIMLGLGEQQEEVQALFADAKASGVDIITAGQYMRPSLNHLPVAEYLTPQQFEQYADAARGLGFSAVFIGPLVRSSYHAAEVGHETLLQGNGALPEKNGTGAGSDV